MMNNREAIALLRNLEDALDSYCELNEEGKTAFRMAIESLELFGNSEHLPSAQSDVSDINVGDTVSRQAAIDVLDVGKELLSCALDNMDIVGNDRERLEWGLGLIESCIEDIKEIPSAQTEPIKVSVDREMTEEELKELKKIADSPVVLFPSAQPEIIRCKDCKHSKHWYRDKRRCFLWAEDGIGVFDDGFCSYAERKENG